MAKSAAYSALLSFIPVLTALATLLVQFNAERVSLLISRFLFVAVPPGAQEFVEYSFTARGERPVSVLVIATLLSLYAASGVMDSLMQGFRIAYRLPKGRGFWMNRLMAVFLVLITAAPVVSASTLIVVGDVAERWVLTRIGVFSVGQQLRDSLLIAGGLVRYLVALAAIALAAACLYFFGPNRRQSWSKVWPGAVLATFLWLGATALFGWYVRNIANYNVMYGSVGAVMALLVWMYVLSAISLIGCEFNVAVEREARIVRGESDRA